MTAEMHSPEPSVAVVIPTIGRPSLIRAVKSANEQTVPVRTIVVLDRPAQENSVTESLAGLQYELHMTTGGVRGGSARNLGVRASADVDFVAFLDDDDEWKPSKIASQLEIAMNEAGSVVSCLTELRGKATRVLPERPFTGSTDMATYLLDRSTITLRRNFMQTSSLLIPRALALEIQWDEALRRHQDWDLLIRLHQAGVRIITVNEPLVTVHQGSEESVSKSVDWASSETWLNSLTAPLSRTSKGDFLASIVARAAFGSGSFVRAFALLGKAVANHAHPTALLVGASGAADWARRGRR